MRFITGIVPDTLIRQKPGAALAMALPGTVLLAASGIGKTNPYPGFLREASGNAFAATGILKPI